MHAQSANAMIAGPNRGGLLSQGRHYCVELLLHCVGFVPVRTFAHRDSWTPAVELRDDALTRWLRPGNAVAIGAPSCHPRSNQAHRARWLDLMTGNTSTAVRHGALVCRSARGSRSLLYRYAGKKTPGAGAHYNGIEISNSDRTHARERTTITVP